MGAGGHSDDEEIDLKWASGKCIIPVIIVLLELVFAMAVHIFS